jgi:hypothetical protein
MVAMPARASAPPSPSQPPCAGFTTAVFALWMSWRASTRAVPIGFDSVTVETRHWMEFVRLYSAFQNAAPGTASRLLCLWKPDALFSGNSGSVPEIATRFGLSKSSLRTSDGYREAVKWMMQRP